MKQVAQLVLRTTDIYETSYLNNLPVNPATEPYNNTGYGNIYRTQYTFKSLNLKSLLGDLYEKYDTFNFQLVQISHTLTFDGNAITPLTDQLINVFISGLNFSNTYNSKNGNTYEPLLTSRVITGDFLDVVEPQNIILTFDKIRNNLNNIDITFTYRDFLSNEIKDQVYPDTIYSFIIYGV